jgi:hypothetical protein
VGIMRGCWSLVWVSRWSEGKGGDFWIGLEVELRRGMEWMGWVCIL